MKNKKIFSQNNIRKILLVMGNVICSALLLFSLMVGFIPIAFISIVILVFWQAITFLMIRLAQKQTVITSDNNTIFIEEINEKIL